MPTPADAPYKVAQRLARSGRTYIIDRRGLIAQACQDPSAAKLAVLTPTERRIVTEATPDERAAVVWRRWAALVRERVAEARGTR